MRDSTLDEDAKKDDEPRPNEAGDENGDDEHPTEGDDFELVDLERGLLVLRLNQTRASTIRLTSAKRRDDVITDECVR